MKAVERMQNWKAHNAVCCREQVTPLPWETFKIVQRIHDNQNTDKSVVDEAVKLAKKAHLKNGRRLSTFIPAKKCD
tara:strand:+ start:2162 stop:2389 length:228 start_codon:yes stop_codon:yes gene_type:complete